MSSELAAQHMDIVSANWALELRHWTDPLEKVIDIILYV